MTHIVVQGRGESLGLSLLGAHVDDDGDERETQDAWTKDQCQLKSHKLQLVAPRTLSTGPPVTTHEDWPAHTSRDKLRNNYTSSFASIALMTFFSSSPRRVQATPRTCRSSAPTTSENARMARRQSVDFSCACIKVTKPISVALRKVAVYATVWR